MKKYIILLLLLPILAGAQITVNNNLHKDDLQRIDFSEIDTVGGDWVAKDQSGNGYDMKLVDSNIAVFDGNNGYLSFVDLYGATIESYIGTSVPTKLNDTRIDFAAGDISQLTLSDGNKYLFSEGEASTLYSIKENSYKENLNVSNIINLSGYGYDSLYSSSPESFSANKTTSGTNVAGYNNDIEFINGKTYQIYFNMSGSGSLPLYIAAKNLGGTGLAGSIDQTCILGVNEYTFTAEETDNTASIMWYSTSSNFTDFSISGIKIREVITPINATLVGGEWDKSDLYHPDNLIYGCDIWQSETTDSLLYIPFSEGGNSIKTDADEIQGYIWVSQNQSGEWHNQAETKMLQYTNPTLSNYDPSFWYSSGTPVKRSWEDIQNIWPQIYLDINGLNKTNILISHPVTQKINNTNSSVIEVSQKIDFESLKSSGEIVYSSGYDDIAIGTADFGAISGENSIEYFMAQRTSRIRQNGTVKNIEIYISDVSEISTAEFRFWRSNESGFDIVGTTGDIFTSLVNGLNHIDTIVSGLEEGDYISLKLGSISGFTAQIFDSTICHTPYTRYSENEIVTDFNWVTADSLTSFIPIKTKMEAPVFLTIGDSRTQGAPLHSSFIETTDRTNIEGTTAWNLSDFMGGRSYQNMGHGGDSSTQVLNRLIDDCINIHPRFAVINCGINDLAYKPATKETTISNVEQIVSGCIDADIIPVVILPYSATGMTDSMWVQFDEIYDGIVEFSKNYSELYLVKARPYVGEDRSGFYIGNLWNLKAEYNSDDIHLTPAGYRKVSESIWDKIK